MLTIEGLLTVLGFGATMFALGYEIGTHNDHKTQK